jgi:CRP-like cAMP-binding protein
VGTGGAFGLALRNRDGRLLVGAFTAGTVALLHDVPRTATVRAQTTITYCELQREHVREALAVSDEHPAQLVEKIA